MVRGIGRGHAPNWLTMETEVMTRSRTTGKVCAKVAGPASYLLGAALVVLGALALAGLTMSGSVHAPSQGGALVGALLFLSGVASLLPRPSVVVALGMLAAVGGMFGSVGFHAQHVVAGLGSKPCDCLVVLGPLHHGWYLLLTSGIAMLAVVATARRVDGLPSLSVPVVGLLAALVGWMLATAASSPIGERRAHYEEPWTPVPVLAPAPTVPLALGPTALGEPALPATRHGELEVVVNNADVDAIGIAADVVVLAEDGTLLHRDVITIAEGSARHRIPSNRSQGEPTVPSISSAASVAFSGDGIALQLAPVRWSGEDGERRGTASIVIDGRRGIDLVGRVATGSDRPVPNLDLIVASVPDRSLIGSTEDRVAGARQQQTSVAVRSDAEGRFRVRNWIAGRYVYVRVATPGWARISSGARERQIAMASGVDATPFELPLDSPAGSTSPELFVAVGEILFVPVHIELPEVKDSPIGGIRNWLRVDRSTSIGRPEVAYQSMGWSNIDAMPLPIPEEVTILMSCVALDDASRIDSMSERGVGVANLPGCEPVEFPLRWQTLATLAPPRVQLRPRTPGPWAHVRFRLEGAPQELREVVEDGGGGAWVTVQDTGQPLAGGGYVTWDRGLRLNHGVLEGLVLPEGKYQFELVVCEGVGSFFAASGKDMEIPVQCRPLAGLDISLEFPDERRTSLWVVREAEGQGMPPNDTPTTAIGGDGVDGVRVGARFHSSRRRRFWFVADDVPVLVSAFRLGRVPVSAQARLKAGTTQEVVLR